MFVLIIAGYSVYKIATIKSPETEVNLAREAIALAKKANATQYAGEKLRKAEVLFNQAIEDWNLQNKKLMVFRDFSKTVELSNASLKLSIDAQSDAGTAKNNFKNRLNKQLNELRSQINIFENKYKDLPLGRDVFDRFNKGKINFLEAENNYNKGEYQKGLVLASMAGKNIGSATKDSQAKLQRYFGNYAVWKSNLNAAYETSKKGQSVILVNKTASTVSVLKSGKAIHVFEAEFGPNWMGDKIMKGDRSTPEGKYKVTEKKKGVKTKYHKALLLNYPNNEDLARFEKLKKNGAVPRNAQIGGLIEIHGDGGKGIHWTDGCVALKNKDMDVVYDNCSNSTPVIIIGSDVSFDEFINEKQ